MAWESHAGAVRLPQSVYILKPFIFSQKLLGSYPSLALELPRHCSPFSLLQRFHHLSRWLGLLYHWELAF